MRPGPVLGQVTTQPDPLLRCAALGGGFSESRWGVSGGIATKPSYHQQQLSQPPGGLAQRCTARRRTARSKLVGCCADRLVFADRLARLATDEEVSAFWTELEQAEREGWLCTGGVNFTAVGRKPEDA